MHKTWGFWCALRSCCTDTHLQYIHTYLASYMSVNVFPMLLVHDPRNKFLIRNIYSKLIYVNNLSACLPFTVTPTAVPEPLLWLSSSTRGICTYTLPGMLHVQLRIEMHTVHTVSVVGVRISIIRRGDIPHTYVNHMCASMPRHAPHYTSAYTCIPTT